MDERGNDVAQEDFFGGGGANWCLQRDTYTKLEFVSITRLELCLLT